METRRLDEGVVRTDAPNGLIVLTETMPGLRSAAGGFWVRTASVHEPDGKMGVSHLLEHMVFKGTARRSAKEISLALESRGGSLDAYTGRDHTTFQARVLDADVPLAVDVLTDLVRHPVLRDEDLALERKVVRVVTPGTVTDANDGTPIAGAGSAAPVSSSSICTDARNARRTSAASLRVTSVSSRRARPFASGAASRAPAHPASSAELESCAPFGKPAVPEV